MKSRFDQLIEELREEARITGSVLCLFAKESGEGKVRQIVAYGGAIPIKDLIKQSMIENDPIRKIVQVANKEYLD